MPPSRRCSPSTPRATPRATWRVLPARALGVSAVILAAGAALACGAPGTAAGTPGAGIPDTRSAGALASRATDSSSRMDTIVSLARGDVTGFTEPREAAFRDAASWRAAWAAFHTALVGPDRVPEAPAVDFAREMVVLVAIGERSSGGWAVRVDAVMPEAGGGAVVRYTVTGPGAGCMTTQMMSAPAVAVRAPRVSGPVRFEGRTVTEDC